MTRTAILALAAVVTLASASLAQESDSPTPTSTEDDYAAVVGNAVTGYVIPAYQHLEETTHDLYAEVEGLCVAPSDETRAALARSFAHTVAAWADVDFFRFGPMARDARYERFAFWPDVHGTGARQLRRFLVDEDAALLEPGALAEQSAAVQGLPALERLLYSGSKALTATDTPDAYRCGLALAIASNMDAIASETLSGWTADGGWASLMREPSADNPVYRTHKEAMTEVLKAILTGLEQMRDHRLRPAMGETPEEARASRAPYARAGQALPYLRASAAAIEDFVHASGIVSLVPEEEKWIVNSVAFEFSNLTGALDVAGPDLEVALADTDKYQKLAYAEIVLGSLDNLFQRQLGPAAGLTQGFNSLDGD